MSNKKNISVRLSEADLRRLREVSSRLQVNDSDLFRFAVKLTLGQLTPVAGTDVKGIDLLLTMLSFDGELIRYFEYDAHQLDQIVNKDTEKGHRVAIEDIELASIAAFNTPYLVSQLRAKGWVVNSDVEAMQVLAQYLHQKYIADENELNEVV